MQWTCWQIKFHFLFSKLIIKTSTPISHPMGPPAAQILFYTVGQLCKLTHQFHMQWAYQHTKF